MIFLNGEPDLTARRWCSEYASRRAGQHPVHPGCGAASAARTHQRLVRVAFNRRGGQPDLDHGPDYSAALQLACLALIDSGDEILMPDPKPIRAAFCQRG
jgi:aspartate/methionine/tyrosine aminotransferase